MVCASCAVCAASTFCCACFLVWYKSIPFMVTTVSSAMGMLMATII